MDYRHLTEEEILQLKQQGCSAEDWDRVKKAWETGAEKESDED